MVHSGARRAITKATANARPEASANCALYCNARVDFVDIEHEADELRPDLLIGNSKGFTMSKKHELPLIRIGFPIHDRFGGQRLHHLGYRGTQELFDRIVNTVIEGRQNSSSIGYTYM